MSQMIPINSTYAPIQALVDELARCGMRHAVTCPGSRNAPIALTLAAHPDVEAISVLDERSAGFVALGIAKTSGLPVAVTTTSGTAAANLLPAIVEAREARVPLIALTGDRPPELRDVGAGQAIDQIKLYGDFVKWFCEVGNHLPDRATALHHRQLGCRAYATASHGRPGPVHLNFPLREPLAPRPEALDAAVWEGRADGRPWVEVADPGPLAAMTYAPIGPDPLAGVRRGAIVVGANEHPGIDAVAGLAIELGWPVLADPLSGLRCGPHRHTAVISHYDALLRAEQWTSDHVPDVVIRIGDTPTSKPLRAWLTRTRQVVIDPYLTWHEPTREAELILPLDLAAALPALEVDPADDDWLAGWREADALVPAALAAAPPDLVEPKVCAEIVHGLPAGTTLWVSSSMPIRDIETFAEPRQQPLRILANRGANGIDGVVSSALGAALAGDGPVIALVGELALAHDVSGLLAAARAGAPLGIVCINNGGGGIFDFLPVAEHADSEPYEQHIATPIELDVAGLAQLGGLRHVLAGSPDDAAAQAAPGVLVEIRSDRAANVRGHRDLFTSVAEKLGG